MDDLAKRLLQWVSPMVKWPTRSMDDDLREAAAELARLGAEVEALLALQADAMRYQWLREHSGELAVLADYAADEVLESMWAQGMDDYIDDAIDAARAKGPTDG